MVIRPTEKAQGEGSVPAIDRILVPYDGSALATQALPFATRLALRLRVPVLLIKVTEIGKSLESAAFYGVPLSPELYDEVIREAQADDQKLLEDAAQGLREAGVVVETLVADGPVADTIATLAAPTDVIVMTSHGRGGLRQFVLGSVAEKLVRQGPVPVVLVPATGLEDGPKHSVARGAREALVEARGLLL
jgi:nucleotide-binding universal stress UspA family protein